VALATTRIVVQTPGSNSERTFTQDELNQILAEDKRRHRAQYEKIEKQYQELLTTRS